MTSAGPWSVKGIDPKAREIAKDLARRSGMTLGEWLNQMIIDGGEPEPPPFEPPRGEPFRRPGGSAPTSRTPAYFDEPETSDLARVTRVTRALDALSARLEQAEHRSTLAISGIDQSVMGVLARMDGVEREQTAAGAGFHGALDEVRATQSKLADRLRRMEQDDGPRVEAMKALEGSLARLAAQIYEGESRARTGLAEVRQDLSGITRRVDQIDAKVDAKPDGAEVAESVASRVAERLEAAEARTTAAVRALETSFASLDARLRTAETRLVPEVDADSPERRFERLAAELSQKVEASRVEMAERLRLAADTKLDRMEAALRDLTVHVEAAERQSAKAIDRMGREVVRVAQTLSHRVSTVETRSATAVEQMGGEMARIADAMEVRLRSAEAAQADALERLGGEISKIAERLAERIASSERLSAQAIEEVGDQVARVTDTINQRNERAASDIGERIRQSEERTARLLQETQERLDRRLLEAERRMATDAVVAQAAAPAPAVEPEASVDFADDSEAGFPDDPFSPPRQEASRQGAPGFSAGDFSPASFALSGGAPGLAPPGFASTPLMDDAPETKPEARAQTTVEDEAGADSFQAFADEPVDDELSAAPPFAPPPPAPAPAFMASEPQRASTRELIEAARAAARHASAEAPRGRLRGGHDVFGAAPVPPLEDEPGRRGLAGLWPIKRKKKDPGSTVRTALLASGTAAALVATTVGSYLLYSKDEAPAIVDATAPAAAPSAAAQESAAAEILAPALASAPDASAPPVAPPEDAAPAVAPRPRSAMPASAPAPTVVSAVPAPDQLFANAVRQLNTGDNTGVATLRRAAETGHAPAQFYLAKLYESGAYGIAKNPAEARRWTERAAVGGDTKAMHNLGLYYFDGTGGPKNAVIAASWFRKAAEGGLQDSQYNLARLYEQGYGVPQNPAEAYKWYLIAAGGGDAESKASADRLKARLSPDTQSAAQRAAAAFRTQATRLAGR
jgi:localization factor PodJL